MKDFITRHQPRLTWRQIVLAAVGTALVVGIVAFIDSESPWPLLATSIGSSAALVFTLPGGAFSQPINVIGGQLLCVASGVVARLALGTGWASITVAVSVAVFAMAALRVTHPPAAATPILIVASDAGIHETIWPIILGTVTVVVVGTLFHRLTGTVYPIRTEPRER